jgi:hypothetical protein
VREASPCVCACVCTHVGVCVSLSSCARVCTGACVRGRSPYLELLKGVRLRLRVLVVVQIGPQLLHATPLVSPSFLTTAYGTHMYLQVLQLRHQTVQLLLHILTELLRLLLAARHDCVRKRVPVPTALRPRALFVIAAILVG